MQDENENKLIQIHEKSKMTSSSVTKIPKIRGGKMKKKEVLFRNKRRYQMPAS